MQNPPSNSVGKWLWPIAGAIICLGLGIASGLSSASGPTEWYQNLQKPPGNPPPWVFGPVWTILYLLMGIALGRLIHLKAWPVVVLFVIQFLLNLAWSPMFFGAHQIMAALIIIVLMWITISRTILAAKKVDPVSAYLLIPYLLWVSYATYLNAGIFYLNR